MSNQEKRQQSVRAITGTARTYNEDWLALFVSAGITSGTVDDRMLAWCNARLGTTYTNVNDAMRAFAVSKGASSWDELGTFTLEGPDLLGGAGTFDSATGWTLGAGFSISGGVLNSNGSSGDSFTSFSAGATPGVTYRVTYTITRVSGSMRMQLVSAAGATRSASGTYSDNIVADSTLFYIRQFSFNGTVDNVTIRQL
jgi:hypothetical protein